MNIKTALLMAKLCQLSYEGYPITDKLNEIYPNAKTEFIEKDDTQILIVIGETEIIIVPRGTEPDCLNDWASDFNITKIKTNFGEVHKGFYKAYSKIAKDLKLIVNKEIGKKKIKFAGHSLGGVLTYIGATELWMDNISIDSINTFGAPRIFSKRTAKIYNSVLGKITYKWVNDRDVVTRVPPRIFNFGDVGNFDFFDKDSNLYQNDLSWWDLWWERLGSKLSEVCHLQLAGGINDHFISNYIHNLELQPQNLVLSNSY